METNQQNIFTANSVLETGILDGKALFMYCYNKLPSANYIGNIDGEKAFNAIKEKFAENIHNIYSFRYHDAKSRKCNFNETFMVMRNNCVLEFDTDYCEIYHDGLQDDFINDCVKLMATFKAKPRMQPLEINLITTSRNGLQLKGMEIKRTKLDVDLYYENDFKEVDALIRKRLNQQDDKGIVLLHGLPGTGKTTYLRHLIGKIKKRILFLSPGAAANIMDPEFVDLLIENPNCVLIIEDAENIIMDRKISNNASVSNLLNILDGLLADFLNVQIICTFNNSLTLVDSALLRKGRPIAKYKFGKLGINKSQCLSTTINEPMTIAEIANRPERKQPEESGEVVGFRRTIENVS